MTNIAPERVPSQYRSKPKAVQWYNIIPTIGNEFKELFTRIRSSYDIDNATEYELDVLARIVVLDDSVNAKIEQLGLDRVDTMRVLIKSKITKNTNDATADGIIDALSFIVGNPNVVVQDFEDMSFAVLFLTPITDLQRTILANFDIVPRPHGVRFRGFAEVGQFPQFGSPNLQFGNPQPQFGYLYGNQS